MIVKCLDNFSKISAYFEVSFQKGKTYEVKESRSGKRLLDVGLFNIDFDKVKQHFEEIN
jgi:hypothetical protein